MTGYAYSPSARRYVKVTTLDTGAKPKKKPGDRLIGCPVSWLQRVLPVVKSPKQLAVAIWLWRRRVVCKNSDTFSASNDELKRLKITRYVKYRTLDLLEAAGVISVERDGKSALAVTIIPKKR